MKLKAEMMISKARIEINVAHPFFAYFAMHMKSVEVPKESGITTMATDGKHLYWYRPFVEELTIKQLVAVLIHESMHVAFGHHLRMGARRPFKWNIACDHAINLLLKDAGHELPNLEGICCDPKYKNLNSEAIYNRLPDDEMEKLKIKLRVAGGGGQGKGQADDGVGQIPGGVLPQKTEKGGTMTPVELSEAETLLESDLAAAASQAKKRGLLPGFADGLVKAMHEPSVDWKEYLRSWMMAKKQDDYTWAKLNRNYRHRGLHAPGMIGHEMGEVVIAIDTSGSVSDAAVSQFMSEVAYILEEIKPSKTYVIYCDAKVQKVDEYEEGDVEYEFGVKGRGGTDFNPPFRYVEENDIEPQAFIYLTDGECPPPDITPDYPVLWAVYGYRAKGEPPFGVQVEVEVEGE